MSSHYFNDLAHISCSFPANPTVDHSLDRDLTGFPPHEPLGTGILMGANCGPPQKSVELKGMGGSLVE